MFMIQIRRVGRSCVLGCSEKHALFYILSFEGGAWLQGEERQRINETSAIGTYNKPLTKFQYHLVLV